MVLLAIVDQPGGLSLCSQKSATGSGQDVIQIQFTLFVFF